MRSLLLLPLALAAPPIRAEPAEAPAPAMTAPDEAITAALALFEDRDLEQQMRSTIAQTIDMSMQVQLERLQKQGADIPESAVRRLRKLLGTHADRLVKDLMPTVRMETAAVYARHFSAPELREFKALRANPVMQKTERIMPTLMAELGRIGTKAAAARTEQFQAEVRDLVEVMVREEQAHASAPAT